MPKEIMGKIKNNKKAAAVLFFILILGTFLRAYHYGDLLRFGKDQARDAAIIRDIVDNKEPLPLLGPKAGGTDFKMGPIFYYWQFASAKIFGFSPVAIAYPDLLLSILTIPILFLFLRKYFDQKISLGLTALFSVSFFAVQNGRFAWNPNSLPLFAILLLLAILNLADPESKNRMWWIAAAGIALGVGVQLHTLFVLIAIPVFFLASAFFFWKRTWKLRELTVIIALALLLNVPQITYEARTNFENTRSFFSGITLKSEKKNPFPLNAAMNGAWHIQSNMLFVSSQGDDDDSNFLGLIKDIRGNKKGITEGIGKELPSVLELGFATSLSLFGYFLLLRNLKKEKDEQRRIFLALVGTYIAISFLVLVPLSHVLVLRYFLIVQFVPFVLLGLVFNFLVKKFGVRGIYASLAAISILLFLNVYRVIGELRDFSTGKGDVGVAIWSEEKFAGDFILSHSKPGQEIHFVYEPQNANKFIRSLAYFNSSIDAPAKPNSGDVLEGEEAAYFSLILNTKKEISMQARRFKRQDKYEITDSASFGRIMMYKLERKK